MVSLKYPLVLASASPRRLQLLAQVGITPSEVMAAEVDETPSRGELPAVYAARVAKEKAEKIASFHQGKLILAADTVVALGRRILPKAEDETTARECLARLSGRRHRVYTAVHLISPGAVHTRLVETHVSFKRLSDGEMAAYLASGEWQGKAGGYAIQGLAGAFIPRINGSYTNVVGLPLTETLALLANMRP